MYLGKQLKECEFALKIMIQNCHPCNGTGKVQLYRRDYDAASDEYETVQTGTKECTSCFHARGYLEKRHVKEKARQANSS